MWLSGLGKCWGDGEMRVESREQWVARAKVMFQGVVAVRSWHNGYAAAVNLGKWLVYSMLIGDWV